MTFAKVAEELSAIIEKERSKAFKGDAKSEAAAEANAKPYIDKLNALFEEQENKKQNNFQKDMNKMVAKYGGRVGNANYIHSLLKSTTDHKETNIDIDKKGKRNLQQNFGSSPNYYKHGGLIGDWMGYSGIFGPAQNERAGGKGTMPSYMNSFNPSYMGGIFKRFQKGGNVKDENNSLINSVTNSYGLDEYKRGGLPKYQGGTNISSPPSGGGYTGANYISGPQGDQEDQEDLTNWEKTKRLGNKLLPYASSAYNIGMGLFGQVEPYEEIRNPYEKRAMGILSDRRVDAGPAYERSKMAYNALRKSARDQSQSHGAFSARQHQANLAKRMNDLKIAQWENEKNNQYRLQEAAALGDFGKARQVAKERARMLTDRADANLANYLSTGIGDLSTTAQKVKYDNVLLGTLKDRFPDYTYIGDGKFKYKGGGTYEFNDKSGKMDPAGSVSPSSSIGNFGGGLDWGTSSFSSKR